MIHYVDQITEEMMRYYLGLKDYEHMNKEFMRGNFLETFEIMEKFMRIFDDDDMDFIRMKIKMYKEERERNSQL